VEALQSRIDELTDRLQVEEGRVLEEAGSNEALKGELRRLEGTIKSLQDTVTGLTEQNASLTALSEELDRKHALAISSMSSAQTSSLPDHSVSRSVDVSGTGDGDLFLAPPLSTDVSRRTIRSDQCVVVSDEEGGQSPLTMTARQPVGDRFLEQPNKHVSNKLMLLHQVCSLTNCMTRIVTMSWHLTTGR